MTTKAISVIIPVYNTADYLPRCVDSLLSQTAQNFEIILVDNNSTDNSSNIIAEYVKKYPKKIISLFCKRPGASAARNDGVKKANGSFIAFVDSDDYVENNYIEKILEKIDRDTDIVTINAKGADSDLRLLNWSSDIKKNFIVTGPAPYHAVIRKSVLFTNHIVFHEGIIYEDTALMGSLVLYARKIQKTNGLLYHIEPRQGSVMRQEKWNKKIGDCIFIALDDLYKAFKEKNAIDIYHDELEQVFSVALLYVVSNYLLRFKEGDKYYPKIRSYLREKFPNWMTNKYIRQNYTKKIRVFMYLNYIGLAPTVRRLITIKKVFKK